MRFVPQKSIGQQDVQATNRILSRLVGSRTQLGNQILGLLTEYGTVTFERDPRFRDMTRPKSPQLNRRSGFATCVTRLPLAPLD